MASVVRCRDGSAESKPQEGRGGWVGFCSVRVCCGCVMGQLGLTTFRPPATELGTRGAECGGCGEFSRVDGRQVAAVKETARKKKRERVSSGPRVGIVAQCARLPSARNPTVIREGPTISVRPPGQGALPSPVQMLPVGPATSSTRERKPSGQMRRIFRVGGRRVATVKETADGRGSENEYRVDPSRNRYSVQSLKSAQSTTAIRRGPQFCSTAPPGIALLVRACIPNELNSETTTSGALAGAVTDPSQAVVTGADVEIKDLEAISQSTKTDAEGVY